jgi:hypothetical protein
MTIMEAPDVSPLRQKRHPNNLVAQSDFQAALRGFDETCYGTTTEKKDSNWTTKLRQSVRTSLVRNLTRLIHPIDDQEFQKHVDRYHPHEQEDDRDDDNNDNDTNDMYRQMRDDNEEEGTTEEEYEDEDLLDPQAFSQAQALREQVRQMAQRVQKLRDSVFQRAAVLHQQQHSGNNNNNNNMTMDIRPNVTLPKESSVKTNLQTTFSSLTNLMRNAQLAAIPNKMQNFQETLQVIQKETSEDKILSQTESAILSRNNGANEEASDRLGPSSSDRLAYFLHE